MVTTLYIDGMRSVHCVRAVFTALGSVDGVASAEVMMGRAIIEHEREIPDEVIVDAIRALGYELREITTQRRRLTIRSGDADTLET
jgi:copper chaperone CopZ